ncbi:MAG: MFS transporter [Opitutae bacterium]
MTEDALDSDQGIAETTQKYDLRRNFFNGIVEASFSATALLVAIRHFEASDHAKSLIAGGSCLGFLLAPGFLLMIGKSKLPVSRICSLLMLGTAIGILLSATANSAWVYAGWLLLACVLAGQVPSLMVHIYSRNYPSGQRGRKISGNLMLSAVVGAGTALTIGWVLDQDLNHFRPGAVVIFLFCTCTAYFHLKIPSVPLKPDAGGLGKDLRHALKDRLFFWMLTGWMLMGIGNLVTIPLRVEYLANPVYGIDASNTVVLAITLVVPLFTRVASIPVWGWAFDRFNLAFVRIAINLFFLVGLFLYFQTQDLVFLGLASALIGWATGGGTMAWTLWVTKVAPAGRESSYMSIHSFFTGVRGVPAPFVGYWIITTLGPGQVGWTSVILISMSSLIFLALSTDRRLKTASP